jgi:ammonia channel protein AmtB
LGWFGINGGSVLGFNDQVPPVLINTLVAGSAGTISAGILSYGSYQQANISHFLRGALSGLVAISASCYAVSTPTAAIIGLVGGMVVIFGEKMLEYLKIEDAVGIIPVHLGAGIWGTLALGMYGKYEILETGLSRFEQIGIQVLGITVYGIWAFGVAYLIFKTLNYFLPLRASIQDEQVNLDVVQHPKFEQSEIIRDKN